MGAGARLWRGVALSGLVTLGGCGTTYHVLQVRPAQSTNQGRPLYMLVRAMERQAYLGESYQDATGKVLSPDKSVLRVQALHPGHPTRVLVRLPSKLALALYFLFTKPARGWRLFIEAPVPTLVTVELEDNRIKP